MGKIVITGTGLLTAAGDGVAATFDALERRAMLFSHDTGGIPDFPFATQPWPSAALRWQDIGWPAGDAWANNKKYANFAGHAAVAVARQATCAAVADPQAVERSGIVLAVGVTNGVELARHMQTLAVMAQDDPRPLATLLFDESLDFSYVRGIPSQVGQFVALATGFRGSNMVVHGAESSAGGINALACATRMIESGELDRVIVVGVAAPMSLEILAAFEKREALALSATPGRGPYDARRAGILLGQAAVALVVESASAARRRGKCPLAELEGVASLCAATVGQAIGCAVDAVLDPARGRPDLWWGGGAGSVDADRAECLALRERLPGIPVAGSKGTIGETFECGGLIDVALAIEAMRRGRVPPIGLLDTADPALGGLDFVTGTTRAVSAMRSVLVTSVGLGGSTAAGAVKLSRCAA